MTEYQIFKVLCDIGIVKFLDHTLSKHWFDVFSEKGLQLVLEQNSIQLEHSFKALDIDEISSFLPPSERSLSQLIKIVYQTNSTNEQIQKEKSIEILLAEYQSSGKGRRGKIWVSPVGHNIYLSIKYNHLDNKNISFLPIYISLIITKALTKAGIKGLQIKWPNDLYLDNKKISGSILDCFHSKNSKTLVLGVGLNVTMPVALNTAIDQPYTSLSQHYDNYLCNRNYLLAEILPDLYNCIETFQPNLINDYIMQFDQFSLLKDQDLLIHELTKKYYAKYVGLNQDGSLKVKSEGEFSDVYAADVSVRLEKK